VCTDTSRKKGKYKDSAFSQKRQSTEISDGLKPELFHQFVKEVSTGSYRSN
jgi:hypothetical protein